MKTQGVLQGLLLSGFAAVLCLTGAAPASTASAYDAAPTEVDSDGRCGRCGDGSCVASCGETATTCPRDCGSSEASATEIAPEADARCGKCGDGYCAPRCGETSTNCPADCGISS